MKKKVLSSIKLSVAVFVAILLAESLDLIYPTSAGIIAILTIQPTKRETIKTALGRAYAFVVSLLLSFGCFYFLDLSIEAFLLFVVLYIFICHFMNWTHAITLNAVLISHFVTSARLDKAMVRNEILIFVIGVSMGILANLHLRKNKHHFARLKAETDEQIKKIIARMSERVQRHDMTDYNGQCFKVLEKLLRDTKNTAEKNYNNQLSKNDLEDLHYIAMRERQCVVLYEMYKLIRHLETTPSTATKISEFLDNLSHVLDEENDGTELMKQFKEMHSYMKAHKLPENRQEFEDRARLFCFMKSMEEFIQIKADYIKNERED